MYRLEKRRFFSFLSAVLLIVVARAPQIQAQVVITNLVQLTHAFGQETRIVGDIRLEATVFACNTNSGALIVQDASGVELLEMDSLSTGFQPGDRIRIEGWRCYFHPGTLGICVSAAPLLNNDGLHGPQTYSYEYPFKAGRYPLRVDWFNQIRGSELQVSCVGRIEGQSPGDAHVETNLIHVVRAECFEGNWSRLPNYQLLHPAKVGAVTNFDTGIRTREDMVGIRFEGYFDAPQDGKYLFSLRSDDGSRLLVGNPEVPVRKLGMTAPPAAPAAVIGEPMASLNERRLVTVEGYVEFISVAGKGLRFALRSEPNSIPVALADAGPVKSADLLNAYVRVSGVASGVLTEDQRVVLGSLFMASSRELKIVRNPPGKGPTPSVLTTVLQVHNLTSEEAARELPVKIQGVVTAIAQASDRWMVVQDNTRAVFVSWGRVTNFFPNVGEIWSIDGHTQPGDFAPVISAQEARLLGRSRLPEPARPGWNQLINGSMDVQWAELQGIVAGVQSNILSLLLPEGRQEVRMEGWGESELKPFDKAVVRIRGALFAAWNAETHEVRVGNLTMHNGSITIDKPAPADPFDAPEKTPRGLFLFDAKATPFQRVKVRGQVTYVDSKRMFIEQGPGIQVFPTGRVTLNAGDTVEAVGYPEISGGTPVLREALLRKTGSGVLPAAPLISDSDLAKEEPTSKRIRIEGILAGEHLEDETRVMQVQTPACLFLARVPNGDAPGPLRLGSKLSLTGVFVSTARDPGSTNHVSHFELLLNSPADLAVISAPSWWTLQRLLSVVGVLLVTLALAAVWITLLRRQVTQRTLQLHHEIRERERAERQHALEAERSRIARDLHDDLGSSLTEINILATTGQRPRSGDTTPTLFKAIGDKARGLIAALDVIVWAVDPADNSLQSLADYLSGYAREYLSNSSIACRFKIPVRFPDITLDGEIRHELLMVVKESLNNIVRHAKATEVEFQMDVDDDRLEICISDNGQGFDPAMEAAGHGLKNRAARLSSIGGSCAIESRAGAGTIVRLRLPLPTAIHGRNEKANTTFV